ncbi:aminopeptidase [Svornostia abyssi]|uniref:Aminopeptidase n=1 Tax=Svornostia abyssi TaxID=2898438 RepID=A0ABY5PLN7_9ACTN|nr:aminopeptidase [Parviterribacteraceae bacterium J379]
MNDDAVQRLAELIVRFGANVQPGQVVAVGAEPGKEPLARAIAAAAYEAGAKFVDVTYFDLHVKRARIALADEESLDYVPPWYGERMTQISEMHGARIGLTGPVAPGLLDDLDPQRVARDQLPFLKETIEIVNARTTNWCAAPCPTPAWAELVFPELEPAAALDKLWEQILHVCRLDEDDPVAAWGERAETIVGVASRLSDLRFDAVRFVGPGTDLKVGLLPSSTWIAARFETVDGLVHMPNLPSEEIFTTPDPLRVDGHVTSTKPLVVAGNIIRGLRVTFEDGIATQIDADEGADVMRGITKRDQGAARLGEVALVDGDGRIGPLGTVFYDTLLDENAASHIALGSAYALCVGDEDTEAINTSQIHIDFMIGSPEVDVIGVTASGDEVPVLVGGAWQV